jgi:hypothetical protein
MPIGNWNLQWLNHNSQRSYPLTERATKTDITNTVRIPDSFIVSLYFPVHAGLNVSTDRFYIKTLLVAPTGYNIAIGYDAEDEEEDEELSNPTVGSVMIATATHETNMTYAIAGVDDFSDTIGQIVIGKLDEVSRLPAGLYTFDLAAGELETDAIRPMIRGISSIRAINGVEISDRIYGDVEFVAGTNVRIDVSTANNQPKVIFNAISGLNLSEECECNENKTGECIRCINGICSGDGTFTLGGSACIQVTTADTGAVTGNSITITDTCALPCCGCEELDALKNQIDRFNDGVSTLQNFVNRLSAEVTQMSLVVLGSRLGDSGCSQCG